MPATIGISAASAARRSIEPSKAPTTREATNAVQRFSASQGPRFFALAQTLAKMILLLAQAHLAQVLLRSWRSRT